MISKDKQILFSIIYLFHMAFIFSMVFIFYDTIHNWARINLIHPILGMTPTTYVFLFFGVFFPVVMYGLLKSILIGMAPLYLFIYNKKKIYLLAAIIFFFLPTIFNLISIYF